jgi:hypothetical protein
LLGVAAVVSAAQGELAQCGGLGLAQFSHDV